jgi:hypothetical protein
LATLWKSRYGVICRMTSNKHPVSNIIFYTTMGYCSTYWTVLIKRHCIPTIMAYQVTLITIMKKVYMGMAVMVVLASCSNSEKEAQLKAQQFTIDSMKAVTAETERLRIIEKENTVIYQPAAVTTTTTTTTTPAKKKGWSNVAKGAVIGGVVGAGTGVAVSKDKVKGGVIGGVVGAAAGAGVGAILDKKKKN